MVAAAMISIAVLFGSALAAWFIARLGERAGRLVTPDHRSSHSVPVPTLGGIAVVLPVFVWALFAFDDSALARAALFGGVPIALVGLIDDLRELPASIRLPVHFVGAALALWSIPIQTLSIGHVAIEPSIVTFVVGLVGLVWLVNLYNFMDGIDGIAGAQCLVYCIAVVAIGDIDPSGATMPTILGAASAGFLLVNWAPARVFMGDVGSGTLGLLLGLLGIDLAVRGIVPFVASLILLTPFWFDATYTLCARIATDQQFTVAHRSHAYQKVARRIGHGWTTTIITAMNLLWLLPLAWFASSNAGLGLVVLAVATLPYAVACIAVRAGIPEAFDR